MISILREVFSSNREMVGSVRGRTVAVPSRAPRPVRRRRPSSPARPRRPFPREDRPRRALNIAVAALGLIVSAPLMLVIALLIKLTSPGPVLFTQWRVGLNRRRNGTARSHWVGTARGNGRRRADGARRFDHGGRLFRIYKFRTMTHATAEEERQVWARPDDPRVTPIGRVLRKYRLDELPQLFNVLKGDMNVVGPRPEQPEIFERLRADLSRYADRQWARPGITGWAQVNQGYDRSKEDVQRKLRYDLEYLTQQSALEDLRIMARTLPAVLFKNGAL